jgi:hypothetical protein
MEEKKKEMFELDFDAIKKNRKTLKEHIKASHEVQGDMVLSEEESKLKVEKKLTNLYW